MQLHTSTLDTAARLELFDCLTDVDLERAAVRRAFVDTAERVRQTVLDRGTTLVAVSRASGGADQDLISALNMSRIQAGRFNFKRLILAALYLGLALEGPLASLVPQYALDAARLGVPLPPA